jgi:hypothetical protein
LEIKCCIFEKIQTWFQLEVIVTGDIYQRNCVGFKASNHE